MTLDRRDITFRITYHADVRVGPLEVELLERRDIGDIFHEHLPWNFCNPQKVSIW